MTPRAVLWPGCRGVVEVVVSFLTRGPRAASWICHSPVVPRHICCDSAHLTQSWNVSCTATTRPTTASGAWGPGTHCPAQQPAGDVPPPRTQVEKTLRSIAHLPPVTWGPWVLQGRGQTGTGHMQPGRNFPTMEARNVGCGDRAHSGGFGPECARRVWPTAPRDSGLCRWMARETQGSSSLTACILHGTSGCLSKLLRVLRRALQSGAGAAWLAGCIPGGPSAASEWPQPTQAEMLLGIPVVVHLVWLTHPPGGCMPPRGPGSRRGERFLRMKITEERGVPVWMTQDLKDKESNPAPERENTFLCCSVERWSEKLIHCFCFLSCSCLGQLDASNYLCTGGVEMCPAGVMLNK